MLLWLGDDFTLKLGASSKLRNEKGRLRFRDRPFFVSSFKIFMADPPGLEPGTFRSVV